MSKEILSDASLAQQHATAIASALSLMSTSTITKDETSTISGNTSASTLIDKQMTSLTAIQSQLAQMISNIHGISSDFTVQDQQLAGNFKSIYSK